MKNSAEPEWDQTRTMVRTGPRVSGRWRPISVVQARATEELRCKTIFPFFFSQGKGTGPLDNAGIAGQSTQVPECLDRRIHGLTRRVRFAQIRRIYGAADRSTTVDAGALLAATSVNRASSHTARQTCTPSRACDRAIAARMPRFTLVAQATLAVRTLFRRAMILPTSGRIMNKASPGSQHEKPGARQLLANALTIGG